MLPWAIIGWLILISLFAAPVWFLATALYQFVRSRVRHYQTRNVVPAVGQVWVQYTQKIYVDAADEATLRVAFDYPRRDGFIPRTTITWADWPAWMRSRKLYLDAKPWK